MPPSNKKILIVGPGRCGTTFLMELFIQLGLDVRHTEIFRSREVRARLKSNSLVDWPRFLKGTGYLCKNLYRWVDSQNWDVEHIFLCVRDLDANVASLAAFRRGRKFRNMSKEQRLEFTRHEIPHTVGTALLNIIGRDYPFTIVKFPKSAQDFEYAYEAIRVVPEITTMEKSEVKEAWINTVNEKLIRYGG